MMTEVGATVVHVERFGRKPREILRTTIVRETKAQWVDDNGTKWRKSDGAMIPQYIAPRFIMTPEEFAKAQ